MITILISACGGGGGNSGSSSSTASTVTPTVVVSALNYQLDKVSMTTSTSDKTTLTITALDSLNNPMSGITTTVALDNGIYTPVNTVTDSSGIAVGVITTGANKSNRTINAKIGVKGAAAPLSTASIDVTGSVITLTPTPASVTSGKSVKLDIKVADASGVGISNTPVKLSGGLGFTQSLTTDLNGLAVATVSSTPVVSGTYSIVATGVGTTATSYVQVVSSDPNSIPPVDSTKFTVSAASLAGVPNTVAPNKAGSTTNRAALRAVFQDKSNKGIQNIRVRFDITSPSLGANEQILSGSSIVYTDSAGVALSYYIPDTRSSPTNGVIVRACWGYTDNEITDALCNDPTNTQQVSTKLTVAAQPLSVSIGDDNTLTRGNGALTYIKKFDVAVADAAGVAVPDAVISISVDITHYGKGGYSYGGVGTLPDGSTRTFVYPQTFDLPPNVNTLTPASSLPLPVYLTTPPGPTTGRIWCPNEDSNRNGVLDALPMIEDINLNGKLEPRKSDVIISFVGKNTTDASGRLAIQVEYAQSVATWLAFTIRATTSVSGSEGLDQRSYLPWFIQGDDINGSFLTPPNGKGACNSAN